MPEYLAQSSLAQALGLSIQTLRRQQQAPSHLQEPVYQFALAALLSSLPPCPALTQEQFREVMRRLPISQRVLRRYRTRDINDLLRQQWFALAAQALRYGLAPVAFIEQKKRTQTLHRRGGSIFVPAGRFQKGPTTDPFKQGPRK